MEDGYHLVQGKLTNFFLWSRSLSLDEMQQMTDSCNHNINKTGNLNSSKSSFIAKSKPFACTIHYDSELLQKKRTLFLGLLLNWRNVDLGSINPERMRVMTVFAGKVCDKKRKVAVLVNKRLRYFAQILNVPIIVH